MRRTMALAALLAAPAFAAADRPTAAFPLWSGLAPAALGTAATDTPTLTPFWPDPAVATGAAMIVCPGGGYNVLAPHEGDVYAKWLNDLGVAAFVLKYRLVKDGYRVPVSLTDAARAVRTVRHHAKDWTLDPARVGMIGSSAGGHLTATLMTQCDAGDAANADPVERVSSRPDLGVLCYAFILFDGPDKNGRHERFLGPNATPDAIKRLSPRLNVTKDTPPCFVWQTVEDATVTPDNALAFGEALRAAGVPFDLHLYAQGKHGIGLGVKEYNAATLHPWTRDCRFWLHGRGFAKAP